MQSGVREPVHVGPNRLKRLLSFRSLFAITLAFASPDHIPEALRGVGPLAGIICILIAAVIFGCPWIFISSELGFLLPACGGFSEWAFLCPRVIAQTGGYCYLASLIGTFAIHLQVCPSAALGLVGASHQASEIFVWCFLIVLSPLLNYTGLVPVTNMAAVEAVVIIGCWTFVFCYSLSALTFSGFGSWGEDLQWGVMWRELCIQYNIYGAMACLSEEAETGLAGPLLSGLGLSVIVYVMAVLSLVVKVPDVGKWDHSAFWALEDIPAGVPQSASILSSMGGAVVMLAAAGRTLYTLAQYHAVPLWDRLRRTHLNADLDRSPVVAMVVVAVLTVPCIAIPNEILRDVIVFLTVCGQFIAVAAFLLAHSARRRRDFAAQRQAMAPGVWSTWSVDEKIARTGGWLRMSVCAIPALLVASVVVAGSTLLTVVAGVGVVGFLWIITLVDWGLRWRKWEEKPPDVRIRESNRQQPGPEQAEVSL